MGQTPEADGSEAQPPPPAVQPEINYDYFHDQLAPFGTWININDTMYWRPDAAINANPDWRPYYDMGQWVQTDNGLFWQSDYTWGDIPFHYGRWVCDPVRGWLWLPDYTWGPAWVFWREEDEDGAIGWAPLPPGAVFADGRWFYHGSYFALDYNFGLGDDFFVFVSFGHFHDQFFRMRGREYHFNLDRAHVHSLYVRSRINNSFHADGNGRLVNDGIGRERIENLTRVAHAGPFQERFPVGDRNRLAAQQAQAYHALPNAVHAQPNPVHAQPFLFRAPVSNVYRPPLFTPRAPALKKTYTPPQKQ